MTLLTRLFDSTGSFLFFHICLKEEIGILNRMNALFFGTKRREEKLAIVFDVGSASVGAALVGLKAESLPRIFYITRHEMPFSKEIDAARLVKDVAYAISSSARAIIREGFPHARFTFFGTLKPILLSYVLASPWHISQTRIIRREDSRPFRVDRNLVRDLVRHELELFRKEYAERAARHNRKDLHEIIEADILDMRLNKYPVDHPHGQFTRDLEMTLFVSLAPQKTLEMIRTAGEREFPHTDTHFASFTFASFSAVRDIWHEKEDFLLVDVGGEVTDLSIVKDGRLLETLSFPIGRNTIIRRVALSLSISTEESMSLLSMHREGHLHEDRLKQIIPILGDAVTEWLTFFSKELEEISSQILLPRDLFLTADKPLERLFKDVISSNRLSHVMPAGKPFSVALFDEKTFAPYCHAGRDVEKDPFLILEAIFLNRKIGVV